MHVMLGLTGDLYTDAPLHCRMSVAAAGPVQPWLCKRGCRALAVRLNAVWGTAEKVKSTEHADAGLCECESRPFI